MAWHRESAGRHAAAIKAGEVSSSALVQYYISRIEAFDGRVNAVVVRTFEAAKARAKLADEATARGESWGPLHGVPITIKEAFWMEGTLSTCGGVPGLGDFIASSNAPAVQRLLDAGAVIIGKTNVPVGAADFQTYNDKYGTTNNPWDLSKIPGGSSGGSAAAMAAGFSALELGSDIGGSIRNPAHFCGVCGHKPTYGIVPLHGHSPGSNHPEVEPDPKPQLGRFDPSFHHDLPVAGPIARTCGDLEVALRAIAGPEPLMQSNGWSFTLPPAQVVNPESLRVAAWLDDPFCPVDRECVALMTKAAEALRGAGAAVDFQARPDFKFARSSQFYMELLSIEMGVEPEPVPYSKIQSLKARRWYFKQRWREFFKRFDVLLCPVMPMTAFKHDHRPMPDRRIHINGIETDLTGTIQWAGLIIFADLPSTVVPVGRDASGMPCGMQVVSSHWQDLQTIEVGKMLERLGFGVTLPDAFSQQPPIASKL